MVCVCVCVSVRCVCVCGVYVVVYVRVCIQFSHFVIICKHVHTLVGVGTHQWVCECLEKWVYWSWIPVPPVFIYVYSMGSALEALWGFFFLLGEGGGGVVCKHQQQ